MPYLDEVQILDLNFVNLNWFIDLKSISSINDFEHPKALLKFWWFYVIKISIILFQKCICKGLPVKSTKIDLKPINIDLKLDP